MQYTQRDNKDISHRRRAQLGVFKHKTKGSKAKCTDKGQGLSNKTGNMTDYTYTKHEGHMNKAKDLQIIT